jgi:F-box-like
MSAPGHRYRIRSPLNSPRERSSSNHSSRLVHAPPPPPPPPPNLDASDDGTDSDSDTAVDDSGREGSSTPNSRETSVPPSREPPPFAGLRDEIFPEQALAATIPYEIILNIFRYLEPFGVDHYRCLYVCKAWAKCAVESVWFRPLIKNIATFYKFASVLTAANRNCGTLFPYAQFVRRLNLLAVSREMTPRYLAMLADCTQLERLTMGGAFLISDSAVRAIVPGFKKLLALDLSLVDLVDDGLCAVAESCRLLQGLNVSQCSRLTDKSVQAIADNCHNLRRVLLLSYYTNQVKTFGLRPDYGCTFGYTCTERKVLVGTRLEPVYLCKGILPTDAYSLQNQ